jgi:hypothetical protein
MITAVPTTGGNYDGARLRRLGAGFATSATVTFDTTGTCNGTGTRSGSSFSDYWYLPVTVGIGASYWVRATLTSGDALSSGTFGAWTQMNAARSWNHSVAGGGYRESLILFEVASDAGGINKVYTGSITIIADATL